MHVRPPTTPLVVFQDADTKGSRCINALHVQTFIANPFGDKKGTLITFANGDRATVVDDFDAVYRVFSAEHVHG